MATPSTAAVAIAAQTDPAKLATLKGERAANPRMQRCVYWLATAGGQEPSAVLDEPAKLRGRPEKDQKIDSLIRADGRQLSGPVA